MPREQTDPREISPQQPQQPQQTSQQTSQQTQEGYLLWMEQTHLPQLQQLQQELQQVQKVQKDAWVGDDVYQQPSPPRPRTPVTYYQQRSRPYLPPPRPLPTDSRESPTAPSSRTPQQNPNHPIQPEAGRSRPRNRFDPPRGADPSSQPERSEGSRGRGYSGPGS
jgi:hypothetical protein